MLLWCTRWVIFVGWASAFLACGEASEPSVEHPLAPIPEPASPRVSASENRQVKRKPQPKVDAPKKKKRKKIVLSASDDHAFDPNDNSCEHSPTCGEDGRCGGGHQESCFVRGSEDCKHSRVCRIEGRCLFDPTISRSCIKDRTKKGPGPCESTCSTQGLCALNRGHCMATEAKHCAESKACSVAGRCDLGPDREGIGGSQCVASQPQHCTESSECKVYDRCKLHEHYCVDPKLEKPRSAYGANRCLRGRACASEDRCLMAPDKTCKTSVEAGLAAID